MSTPMSLDRLLLERNLSVPPHPRLILMRMWGLVDAPDPDIAKATGTRDFLE